MPRKRLLVVTAVVVTLGTASIALAAPTSSAPPTVEGTPEYGSSLACKPGSWSADAVSFSYAWIWQSYTLASTQQWTPTAGDVGRAGVICRVTATDAAGATTTADAAGVTITTAATTFKLTTKKSQKKKLVLTGVVGPKGALGKTAAARSSNVVAYEVLKSGELRQVFGKQSVDAKGKFKITGKGEPFGTHTYKINFNPVDPQLWTPQSKTIKVKLKKK